LITEIVTNNAVAILMTPMAFSIGTGLGMPVEPLVLAVMFGANMSYLTPVGYQTNLMVMNAGGYRYTDFVRLGLPLQLMAWVLLSRLLAMGVGVRPGAAGRADERACGEDHRVRPAPAGAGEPADRDRAGGHHPRAVRRLLGLRLVGGTAARSESARDQGLSRRAAADRDPAAPPEVDHVRPAAHGGVGAGAQPRRAGSRPVEHAPFGARVARDLDRVARRAQPAARAAVRRLRLDLRRGGDPRHHRRSRGRARQH